MKKLLPLLLLFSLAGCAPPPADIPAVEVLAPAPAPAEPLSLGLAAAAHLQKSMHATEAFPGRVHLEVTVAAVLVDGSGVIRGCAIDGIRAVVPFDRTGGPLLYAGTVFPSKCALGRDYGMARASSLGKEWHTQAAELAADCIGKRAAELTAGDVVTSVTIAHDDALAAVAEAAENAVSATVLTAESLRLTCRGEVVEAVAAFADTNGLVTLRCAAMAEAGPDRQTCALMAAVPITAAGTVACPTHMELSSLSDVLYPTAFTEVDRALLAEK